MFGTFKHHTLAHLGTLLLSGICLTGCFATAEDPLESSSNPASVVLDIPIEASTTSAKMLVIVLSSNKGDTLRDTITENGSLRSLRYAFLGTRTGIKHQVRPEYSLAPNRTWKIAARLLDGRDSLKQSGSGTIEKLKAFEYRESPVTMDGQRFVSYAAQFDLPAGMMLTGLEGASMRQVYFTRLQLSVDGKVVSDSVSSGLRAGYLAVSESRLKGALGLRFFDPAAINGVTLADDYMIPGARKIVLNAYGYLEGDTVGVTPPRLLFRGGKVLDAGLAKAAAVDGEMVSLDWQVEEAPADADQLGLRVKLGKVGKVVVVAQASGALVL